MNAYVHEDGIFVNSLILFFPFVFFSYSCRCCTFSVVVLFVVNRN